MDRGRVYLLEVEYNEFGNIENSSTDVKPKKIPVLYMQAEAGIFGPGIGFAYSVDPETGQEILEPWVFSPPFLGVTEEGEFLYSIPEKLDFETIPISVWKIRELFTKKPRKKTKENIIERLKVLYDDLCESQLVNTIGHSE